MVDKQACPYHERMEEEDERQWEEIGRRVPNSVIFWVIGGMGGIMALGLIMLIGVQGAIYTKVSDIQSNMSGLTVTVSSTERRLEDHMKEWNRYRATIERNTKIIADDRNKDEP